ncbi:MAG: sigma-70 family RNA polymerase sigma factor [Limnothrix sp. RL_2_0]|nr:sigma-70 family RNA polymerase sigma factor [Limnothrix sp. RL_2_0]
MSILSTQDLQNIDDSKDLQKIFLKLGYEDAYGEIDVEDLELTDTQTSAVYRAYLIASYQNDSLQVILFELQWKEEHILRQRLQAIAKNLSQRPALYIVLGTTDYENLLLINVDKKFKEDMTLLSIIKQTKIKLNNPSSFEVNLLNSLATKERSSKEIYQAQHRTIQYSIHRTKERKRPKDAIGSYLHQIGQISLLKPEEEIILARQIKPLIEIEEKKEYLKGRLRREPTEGELSKSLSFSVEELKRRIKSGSRAKNKLVMANLRLVVSNAKKHTGRGLELLDLIQEGNLGLIRATEKFDPEAGTRFSTYATWWIRQAITRAIFDQSRVVRLPVHLWEKYYKFRQLIRPNNQGEIASLEAIASDLAITIDKLYSLKRIFLSPVSLDMSMRDDPSSTLGDFISYKYLIYNSGKTIYQKIYYEQLVAFLKSHLKLKQIQVIIYRFGLFDNNAKSLQEIGDKFQVSRERIRQIEAQSLSKLSRKYHVFNRIPTTKVKPLSLRELLMVKARYRFIQVNWQNNYESLERIVSLLDTEENSQNGITGLY